MVSGYPLLIRAASIGTGLSLPVAGLLVGWCSWYVFLIVVWRLLDDSITRTTRWSCLLLFAFAPGAIYLAALFPISTTLAAIAACLYFLYRSTSRWAPAGALVAGLVAGCSYISALALVPALLVGLMVAGRAAWRSAVAAGLGLATGFAGVLVAGHAVAGAWDAYFIAQRKNTGGTHDPFVRFWDHLRPLWHRDLPRPGLQHATAGQTLFTLALLGLAVLATSITSARRRPDGPDRAIRAVARGASPRTGALTLIRTRLDPLDAAALTVAIGAWLSAYAAGDRISSWRSEAFVVVAALPLRRLPMRVLTVPLLAAGYVAWNLAPYYFNGQLV